MSISHVGFYRELGPGRPGLYHGSIYDAISEEPILDELKLIDYLHQGVPLIDIMEAGQDVISHDKYIAGCSSILSDGSWIWRLDLPYYLGRYHLHLDSKFLEHVKGMQYRVPVLAKGQISSLAQNVAFNVLGMSH